MKARPRPVPEPDATDVMWDHGDRLDTLERRDSEGSLFVREQCFILATSGSSAPPVIPITPPTYEQSGGWTTATYTGLRGQFDPAGLTSVELFIVSGGGGGARSNSSGEPGGGGGGGAVKHETAYDVSGLTAPVEIAVGTGGISGHRGGSSTFGTVTIIGGGGGVGHGSSGGEDGSSGGGAYSDRTSSPGTGVTGLGSPGGGHGSFPTYSGAGGGGGANPTASGVGEDGYSVSFAPYDTHAGNGGAGIIYTISGQSLAYGSGGGAAWHPQLSSDGGNATGFFSGGGDGAKLAQAPNPTYGAVTGIEAQDGKPTSGGGGGGGCRLDDNGVFYGAPGEGGSGVVIIKWFGSPPSP